MCLAMPKSAMTSWSELGLMLCAHRQSVRERTRQREEESALEQVLRLDVTVHDVVIVQVLDALLCTPRGVRSHRQGD